jgi:hypothetical protein
MGLDPRHLDASGGAMLDSLSQQEDPSLPAHFSSHPQPQNLNLNLNQVPSTSTTTDPSSLLQRPPSPVSDPPITADDDFDMYSFLNLGRDGGPGDDGSTGAGIGVGVGVGVGADVDHGDPSTAFLDDVQMPMPPPELEPQPERRMSVSPVSSKKSEGGRKRKSDAAQLGEVQMEVPAPAVVVGGQPPPKRGGVKMNMNVAGTVTRSTKRRRQK